MTRPRTSCQRHQTARTDSRAGSVIRAHEWSAWVLEVMDLVFVAVVIGFFGLTLGYAAFCDRL
jgi:hypothetical protein